MEIKGKDKKWIEKMDFNEKDGSIQMFKVRHTIINSDTFRHIRDSILKIVGPAADSLLYLSAKNHTEEYLKEVLKNSSMAKFATKFKWGREGITKKASQILTEYGFGKMDVEKIDLDGQSIAIMKNSCIGMSYRKKGKSKVPTCSYIAGLIAGGATTINKSNYECKEVLCVGKGDKICKFVLEKSK
jgi:predicted hydrocarbon binding protein